MATEHPLFQTVPNRKHVTYKNSNIFKEALHKMCVISGGHFDICPLPRPRVTEKVILKMLGKFQSDSYENTIMHLAHKFRHNFIKSATNGRPRKTLITDIK